MGEEQCWQGGKVGVVFCGVVARVRRHKARGMQPEVHHCFFPLLLSTATTNNNHNRSYLVAATPP